MLAFEEEAYACGYGRIAGIDEAGRGPLAGPVVAAACIIPRGRIIPGVNDSKQLTPLQRDKLFDLLTEDKEICFAVGLADALEIDQINIYQATRLAMGRAVVGLTQEPDFLLVDGMPLPHLAIPNKKIVRGDVLSQSIAAASIIAKVTRDRMMLEYHLKWPEYAFDRHKGYGTAFHLAALKQYGPCAIHRKSFAPVLSLVV